MDCWPEQFETARLILRVPTVDDAPIVCASVRASLGELKPWMPWASDGYDERAASEWCARSRQKFEERSELQLIILSRQTGEHLGSVGAFKIDRAIPKGEIGYWMGTRFCGRGLMTEAVIALRDLLIDAMHFRRVEIRMDDQNLRSAKVAERAGFSLDAVLRNDCRGKDGELRDSRIYSRVS